MKHAMLVVGLCGLCQSAIAQSGPAWAGFEPHVVSAGFTLWDEDGPGPGRSVLVVGDLNEPGSLSSPTHGRIATYDGRAWQTIGQRFSTALPVWVIYDITVANTSGVGSPQPGLYVAGRFEEVGGEPIKNLAHWDGSRWNLMPGSPDGWDARSAFMFDEDGEGPREESLFVGGQFFETAGLHNPGLLRWDGTAFTQVGGGMAGRFPTSIPYVLSMIEFDDDGPGPRKSALYVGGSFEFIDGQVVRGIARWDGTNWESLGSETNDSVATLAVFDADGDGPEVPMLYAGGTFVIDPGGEEIWFLARWDGQSWSRVPGYTGGGVGTLAVFDDDGDGPNKPALFVAGLFTHIGGVRMNYITKWDGTEWFPLDTGFTGFRGSVTQDLQVFDEDNDPSTPDGIYASAIVFYAGGIFTPQFARWGMPNPVCFADCDESTGVGTLDLFDFLCFQNSFVTGDAYACNCDTSTGLLVCDLFDFLCFQRAFVGGCN